MIIAIIGILLVVGGLYVLTRTAPVWQQLFALLVQVASMFPMGTWDRVEYLAAVAAILLGSLLILLRLLGGLRRI